MAVEPQVVIPDLHEDDASSCGPVQFDQLRKVPLFSALSNDAIAQVCALLISREYKTARRVFKAGEKGDAMYLIERGTVRISVTDADGHEVSLTELGEGDFFGEMALIDGHERSASATVTDGARLAVLTREDFVAFVTSDTQVMLTMLGAMARRLRRTDNLLRHRVARNANTENAARTTAADRAADLIASFGGSWRFIGLALFLIMIWIGLNTWLMQQKGFDPFPYVLLNLVLGIITGLQAPIIMMSQNRQAQKDRIRADLDYEVNLKNELLLSEIVTRLQQQDRKRSATEQRER
ncbi:MAG: DUF1003 domain-containing protein [Verrucomicrobiota bacterium]|nr:DUF1003 domain-containing protein [Verrucomicrobiota bacterium]